MAVNLVTGHEYLVRAAALAADDPLMRGILLTLIDETEDQALEALRCSCWEEDLRANEAEQRALLRRSLMSFVPNHLRPVGWDLVARPR